MRITINCPIINNVSTNVLGNFEGVFCAGSFQYLTKCRLNSYSYSYMRIVCSFETNRHHVFAYGTMRLMYLSTIYLVRKFQSSLRLRSLRVLVCYVLSFMRRTFLIKGKIIHLTISSVMGQNSLQRDDHRDVGGNNTYLYVFVMRTCSRRCVSYLNHASRRVTRRTLVLACVRR